MHKTLKFGIMIALLIIFGCSKKEILAESSMDIVAQNSDSVISPMKIELSDFSVKKIDSNLIIALFGNFMDVEAELGSASPQPLMNTQFSYSWSSIYLEWLKRTGVILRIIVKGEEFETKRGIKVGDSIEKIDQLYGMNSGYRKNEQIQYNLGNEEAESMMALIFYIADGVVVRIELMQGT